MKGTAAKLYHSVGNGFTQEVGSQVSKCEVEAVLSRDIGCTLIFVDLGHDIETKVSNVDLGSSCLDGKMHLLFYGDLLT